MKAIAGLVGVSLSSVSYWVRDVPLTDEQRAALQRRDSARNSQRRGSIANSSRSRARRRGSQACGRTDARQRDPFHAAGCMLFWAEGSRSRNSVVFTNSDPAMARYFVSFLRSYFSIEDSAFRVDCNLFADHVERQKEIERFWLNTLGLPTSCLRKSTVKPAYRPLAEKCW
jgi:hypothetical protein